MCIKMACNVLSVLLVLTCVWSSALSAYTSTEQAAILDEHNTLRRGVGAKDMVELVWDSGLATQAQAWADKCYYAHPNKAVYPDYTNIGQNIYIKYPTTNPPSPVTSPVTAWYNEVNYYTYADGICSPGKVCGHYTQIAWASTTKVGCGYKFCEAASSDTKEYTNAWIVVCNYDPSGNVVGKKPYIAGDDCSSCPAAYKYCKNSLCNACSQGEAGCECKLGCQNCGTPSTACECTCPNGYFGSFCETFCENKDDKCGVIPGYPVQFCGLSFVKRKCPKLCGECAEGPVSSGCPTS